MFAEPPYELEPELRYGTTRRSTLKLPSRVGLWLLGCLGLGVACLLGGLASRDLSELEALRSRGVTGRGFISGKRSVHGKSTTYYVSYLLILPTAASTITDEESVSYSAYASARNGDPVPVTYLASLPKVHRLGGVGESRVRAARVAWGFGVLFGAGAFLAIFAILAISCRNELRLARSGTPAPAVVTACVPPRPYGKARDYTVSYRFTTPAGEQQKTSMVSAAFGSSLSQGQTVTVLYDPDNPRSSRLYRALQYTEIKG